MSEVIVARRRPRDSDALARIEVHEAVCAERWRQIIARMNRMERIIVAAGGGLIAGMMTLIGVLLSHPH